MKKLFFSFSILGLTFVSAQKIEISVAYGPGSFFGITDAIAKTLLSPLTDQDSPNSIGVLNANAMLYNGNMRWRYGVEFNSEFFNIKKDTDYQKKIFTSILPKVDYFWTPENKKIRLYSGVSAGILFSKESYKNKNQVDVEEIINNNTIFAFNVTPLGVRYGNKFAIFIEPNLGIRNIVQAGVSYIF
ncbi:hypothetical protein CMU89_16750 [Elizabethkingia anophelis]|uniref:hypothetical protein n=1 Tax=Elizabethkingia anophelis TaxID=1117645 RepID=UPI0009957BCD|nr:hypothetical protein [Elizabethkingia anophelis]AQW94698.1 hypothetical protein BBD30_11125 [Elizabethkingia anophelis]MCL1692007.1 hypothetical protein [Elizabethkingia anophelis]MDV3509061.1 hypothetical protein [Elizabethkingia anophelis]MDV3544290.1 hypothetical protein [Elizabethkingia anophelis]MDV3954193.1 hypothetical protein [Elizabethkingia anophelis]